MIATTYAFGASMSNARTGMSMHSTAIVHNCGVMRYYVPKMGETCLGTVSA